MILGARSVSAAAVSFTVFCLTCAAASYPNAITDQNVYPKPPLPASGPGAPGFGPAGTVYQDPVFGSKIVRLTDAQTTPQGNSFFTVSAAYQNAWANDDLAFFVIADTGNTVLFRFDPLRFKASMLGNVNLGGVVFGFRHPNLLYGVGGADGRTISSYNYVTGAYSPILDLNSVISFSQYVGAVSVAYDDDHFAVPFGGIQDTHPYVVWYEKSTGTQHLMDIANSMIDGVPASIPLNAGSGVHSLQIDMSGRYVEVVIQGLGPVDWDTSTGQCALVPFYPAGSGHIALGFGERINQSGFLTPDGTSDSRGFTRRPLSTPANISTFVPLIAVDPSGPYSWVEDGHWSWNNNKPNQNVPACGSFYSQGPFTPWETWFDEIDCVATDGTGTVWRIAHHRSIYNGNFWSSPRGNVSQDGRYYIFTSNWDETLDPSGQRLDVFLVNLTSAHAMNPQ